MIESQKFISEKFRVGILAPIKQKLKVEVKKEGGEEDEVDVEYHGRLVKFEDLLFAFQARHEPARCKLA